jgi:hypothetical protein
MDINMAYARGECGLGHAKAMPISNFQDSQGSVTRTSFHQSKSHLGQRDKAASQKTSDWFTAAVVSRELSRMASFGNRSVSP